MSAGLKLLDPKSTTTGPDEIALRNAFDERTPEHINEPIAPGPDEVRTILDELGV